ncbi:MAG: MFS transporter [Rhizobiaceae bacterium]|nr:MAG: MFS transporter [Rhizobiaceae bacterium]
MFFLNGFVVGSWAPQIPALVDRLSIDKLTLGLLILGFGFGALTLMPIAGILLARRESRAVVVGFASVVVFSLLAVAAAPHLAVAAVFMFLFGGVVGGMDVAMNANAVTVERRLGRPIMSSSHGFWSLGGFAGGGIGGIAIEEIGSLAHAAIVAAVTLTILIVGASHLVGGDRPIATGARQRLSLPRDPMIYLVGLVALLCMIPEGAVLDWAALYLQNERGAGLATAGFAFALFSATMALMRFVGDRIRHRWGAVATMRVSCLVAATGMAAAGLSPWPWLAIAAFGFAGLGIANIVPIAFSAAGNHPGLSSGTGMSVVTTMGYSGILLAPSAIGFIAQKVGLAPIFVALSAILLVVFLSAGLIRHADFRTDHDRAA